MHRLFTMWVNPLPRLAPAAALLLSLSLSGCASPNRLDLASASLDDSLNALAAKHHVCGVAVAVVKNWNFDSLHAASGCQPAMEVTPDSVFQAASLSKPVFAYAVLKLAAQGTLDLDAPVMRYLPQGYRHRANPLRAEPTDLVADPRLQAVTLRMLLNHTGGLPNWVAGPLRFDADPGTQWIYSGEGYVLLQRAVEAATGRPLDQVMATQVFKPLGMDNSSYVQTERSAKNLLPGTKANGEPRATIAFKSPVAAFTLTTTATDYGKFLVAVLGTAQVLEQTTAAPVVADRALGLDWGLGWGMEREHGDKYANGTYIWHWGNNPGYRAFVMASARTGDGFVMLTNSDNGLALAEPVAQKILPGEHRLFDFHLLGSGIANRLCSAVGVCL